MFKKGNNNLAITIFLFSSHLKLNIINNVCRFLYGKDILGIFVIYYYTAYKAYCDLFVVPCIIIFLEPAFACLIPF